MTIEQENKMIEENLNLVGFCLKKYKASPNEWEDLYQEGCLGLVGAVKRFNPDLGIKFSTFAIPCIIGYMKRYKRDHCHTIRLPRDAYALQFKIKDYEYKHPDCTEEDIIRDLEIKIEDYHDLQRALTISSLNYTIEAGHSTDIIDLIESDFTEYNLLGNAYENDLIKAIKNAIPKKDIKMQEIIIEYLIREYRGEKVSQTVLGEKYGIGQVQTSRYIRRGLALLKEKLPRYYDCSGYIKN